MTAGIAAVRNPGAIATSGDPHHRLDAGDAPAAPFAPRLFDEALGFFTPPAVQMQGGADGDAIHHAAAHGTSGASGRLPFIEKIQPLFGEHDVSSVQAHTGSAASAGAGAMGAEAYAVGDHVAFGGTPTLHTAAHEAAHVVQQRGGVTLKGGVGQAGDPYERHADAVADQVVRGESAAGLLDAMPGSGGQVRSSRQMPAQMVQLKNKAAPGTARRGVAPGENEAAAAHDDDLAALAENQPATTSGDDLSSLLSSLPSPPTEFYDERANALLLVSAHAWCVELASALNTVAGGHIGDPVAASSGLVHFESLARNLRQACVSLMNASSVTRADRTQDPTLPSLGDLQAWNQTVHHIRSYLQVPAFACVRNELDAATRAANDASVTMFQAHQVHQARTSWRTNDEEIDCADARKSENPATRAAERKRKRGVARNEVDEVFEAAGMKSQFVSDHQKTEQGGDQIADWCGFTVAANLVRGAGMDPDHAASMAHTTKGVAFFTYQREKSSASVQNYVLNEDNQWKTVEEYHRSRGSARRWISPADMAEIYAAGKEPQVQPGDVVFCDTGDEPTANHYAMADASIDGSGNMTTIEGNATGMKAAADGGAERDRAGNLKSGTYKNARVRRGAERHARSRARQGGRPQSGPSRCRCA